MARGWQDPGKRRVILLVLFFPQKEERHLLSPLSLVDCFLGRRHMKWDTARRPLKESLQTTRWCARAGARRPRGELRWLRLDGAGLLGSQKELPRDFQPSKKNSLQEETSPEPKSSRGREGQARGWSSCPGPTRPPPPAPHVSGVFSLPVGPSSVWCRERARVLLLPATPGPGAA